MVYKDKNGVQIKKGDILHNTYDDSYEYVFRGVTEYGDEDLGVNASNIDYLERIGNIGHQIYPLSDFDTNDFEIIPGTIKDNIDKFTDRQIKLYKYVGVL